MQSGDLEHTDACCDDCAITQPDVEDDDCCGKGSTPGCTTKRGKCCGNDEPKDSASCCSDCDDEKSEDGCCSDCDEEDDNEPQNKDDSFCMCCIKVLVNEPKHDISRFRSSQEGPLSSLIPSDTPEILSGTLRTCCRIFEKYCIRKACCFVSETPSRPSPSTIVTPSARQELKEAKTPLPEVDEHIQKLELHIRGMDCVDCIPKVECALGKLASVTPVNLDYLNGIARLVYDPEVITPEVISGYVARATGFNVKVSDPSSVIDRDHSVTLPLCFPTIPPRSAFEGYSIGDALDSRTVDIQFLVRGEGSRQPRNVFDHFKVYGAQLAPRTLERNRDGATHDFIVIAIRTAVSVVLTIPVLVLAWAKLPHRPILYGAISVGFTTAIQLLAFPIFSQAVRSVVYLQHADMNVLVSVNTLTAYTFSVIAYAFEAAGKPFSAPFFETSGLLVTLILLGRTISAFTRRSTGSALNELRRLQQDEALLVVDNQSPPQPLDSRLLFYNDVIRVPPDTRIATDGIVISGESDVDESSITGESGTIYKCAGTQVVAGTLNCSGILEVQVTQLIHENSLARVASLVKQAQLSRSPIQDLVDRLSSMILPVAVGSAVIAFLVWVLVLHFVRKESSTASSVGALTYAIAILAVSCPCALGLVVPTVVSIAIRRGIREGILFRSAGSLQTGRDVDIVAFDKTGTLTTGDLSVECAEILLEGVEEIIMLLVKDNRHPISQSIYRYLSTRFNPPVGESKIKRAVADITSIPGKGIKASFGGFPLLGGNAEFTGSQTHPLFSSLCASGYSLFSVSLAGQTIAIFGLAAAPRPTAHSLIKDLQSRGKEIHILSGDTRASVDQLAKLLDVPLENTRAGCTPQDKSDVVAAFQACGKRVCFIGDGTNDGPALSTADVALSIVEGSDVALTSAGAVLVNSDIRHGVLALLDIGQASRIHIRLALLWCVIYNLFAILLASGAFVKVRIEPRWAGIGEVVSIVPVVGIALLLDMYCLWKRGLWVRNN